MRRIGAYFCFAILIHSCVPKAKISDAGTRSGTLDSDWVSQSANQLESFLGKTRIDNDDVQRIEKIKNELFAPLVQQFDEYVQKMPQQQLEGDLSDCFARVRGDVDVKTFPKTWMTEFIMLNGKQVYQQLADAAYDLGHGTLERNLDLLNAEPPEVFARKYSSDLDPRPETAPQFEKANRIVFAVPKAKAYSGFFRTTIPVRTSSSLGIYSKYSNSFSTTHKLAAVSLCLQEWVYQLPIKLDDKHAALISNLKLSREKDVNGAPLNLRSEYVLKTTLAEGILTTYQSLIFLTHSPIEGFDTMEILANFLLGQGTANGPISKFASMLPIGVLGPAISGAFAPKFAILKRVSETDFQIDAELLERFNSMKSFRTRRFIQSHDVRNDHWTHEDSPWEKYLYMGDTGMGCPLTRLLPGNGQKSSAVQRIASLFRRTLERLTPK